MNLISGSNQQFKLQLGTARPDSGRYAYTTKELASTRVLAIALACLYQFLLMATRFSMVRQHVVLQMLEKYPLHMWGTADSIA